MLQGESSVKKALELEVCEPEYGREVGYLQLSVSNTASYVYMDEIDNIKDHRFLKTVHD